MKNNHKYAKTFFELCKKIDTISSIQNQLQSIVYLFNKVSAFRLVLITKRLNHDQKVDIIDACNRLNLFMIFTNERHFYH